MTNKFNLRQGIKKYYPLGFLFLIIFGFLLIQEAKAKGISVGTASDNIGIGTDTPGTTYRLNVNGNSNITGNLNVTGNITGTSNLTGILNAGNISAGTFGSNSGGGNYTFPGKLYVGGTTDGLYAINGRGNYNSLLVDNNSGDFKGVYIRHLDGPGSGGCGGDGCYGFKFDDQRNNNYSASGFSPSFIIQRSGAFAQSNLLEVNPHGAAGLVVTNSGSIGIGTNVPKQKLDVIGNVGIGAVASNFSDEGPNLHIWTSDVPVVGYGVGGANPANILIEENDSEQSFAFLGPNSATQKIVFGRASDSGAGQISFNHNTNQYNITGGSVNVAGTFTAGNMGGANLVPDSTNMAAYNGSLASLTFVDGKTIQALDSPQTGSGSCYQWGQTAMIPVNANNDYEFSIWVKANGIQNVYFGFYVYDSSRNQISSGNLGNPYFHTAPEQTNNGWVKITAHLRASATPHDSSYIASVTSNKSGPSVSDYVMPTNTSYSMVRFGSCYGGTSTNGRVYMYNPVIREVSTLYDSNYGSIWSKFNGNDYNVGIGTTDPGSYKLNVNGSLIATSITGAMSGTLNAANLSAGTFGGNTGGGSYSFPSGVVSATVGGNTNPGSTAFQAREYNFGTTGIDHIEQNAPRIGFHWGNRYWGQITYFNNIFSFRNSDLSGYVPITASDGLFTGNVGIGTASPASLLHVMKNSNNDSAFQGLVKIEGANSVESTTGNFDESKPSYGIEFRRWWTPGGAGYDNPQGGIYAWGSNSWGSGLAFRTAASGGTNYTRMVIADQGNVGIGTTGPSAKLDVRGNTTVGDVLNLGNLSSVSTSAYRGITWESNFSDGNYAIYKPAGGWTQPLNIAFYTGIHIGAEAGYGGTKFYNNPNMATELMSVGNGDNNVRIANNLYMGGRIAFNGSSFTSGNAFGIGNGAAYNNANSIAVDTVETDGGVGGGGTLELNYYGGNYVDIGPGGTKPLRAAILYDGNDTSYYMDPNGTSRLNNLTVTGSISGNISNSIYQSFQPNRSGDWASNFSSVPAANRGWGEVSSGGPQGTWWFMDNMRHSNASNVWGTQVAWGWEDNANQLWQRNVTGGSWGAWVKYLNSSNYNSYAPTLSGGGASGTWGIDITGGAGKLNGVGNTPNASYPGQGLKTFYNWGGSNCNGRGPTDECYANGISIGSHPGDQSYGFQIVQNMWDDNLYFRRYNAGWQTWFSVVYKDSANNSTIGGTMTAAGFIYNSDVKLKKNIATIESPLTKILQLRGVTFNWKKDNTPGVGLIAQEVEKVFPELVSEQNGIKSVQYGNLVAPLIEAVKEQQKEIQAQTDLANAQQQEIESMKAQIQILQAKN